MSRSIKRIISYIAFGIMFIPTILVIVSKAF